MTREEHDNIILWAREAGLHYYVNSLGEESYAKRLDHFGRLYAAAEREECAKLCDAYDLPGAMSPTAQFLAHAIRARGEL